MTIRTRRLRNDYQKILEELSGSEAVSVRPVAGDPPHTYEVTYDLTGLSWDADQGCAVPVTRHVIAITLPVEYPRVGPRCIPQRPIWHPNIGDYVCIGDYWSAGVTLVDIIAHIGDMIQYKTYNLRSPVNKAAAAWAERRTKSFPLSTCGIVPPESTGTAVEPAAPPDSVEIVLGPQREHR